MLHTALTQSDFPRRRAGSAKSTRYDVAFCAASWDSRCTAITDVCESVDVVIIATFVNHEASPRAQRHLARIIDWCDRIGATSVRVAVDSSAPAPALNVVLALLAEHRAARHTARSDPARYLVDLDGLPRFLSLGVLPSLAEPAGGLSVDFVYETSTYGFSSEQADGPTIERPTRRPPLVRLAETASTLQSVFTRGGWRTITIPGYGATQPAPNRPLTVALGFDGHDTAMCLRRMRFGQLAVVVPDPGVSNDFVRRCETANQVLLRGVGPENVLRAGAIDASGLYRQLLPRLSHGTPHALLPVGTKPHALAMAVAALEVPGTELLYRMPASHVERPSTPRGGIVLYRLRRSGSRP